MKAMAMAITMLLMVLSAAHSVESAVVHLSHVKSLSFHNGRESFGEDGTQYPQMAYAIEDDFWQHISQPSEAICQNKGPDLLGNLIWDCEFKGSTRHATRYQVLCDPYEALDDAVLLESCRITYELSPPSTRSCFWVLFLHGTISLVLARVFWLIGYGVFRRINKYL